MFGFSLATQLFQGSAQRTWNCVANFTNLLWYKFNHIRQPIMPRSRRRHHSRSRSRSRSHSHDRDRDVKRRKIDSLESPTHKSSVSSESSSSSLSPSLNETTKTTISSSPQTPTTSTTISNEIMDQIENKDDKLKVVIINEEKEMNLINKNISNLEKENKVLSPKQLAKKLEIEKRKQEKQKEREEREILKENLRLEKLKLKQEKTEQKQKEINEKLKEKELKRKEREEKELKRKEKEQEKLRKQLELEEKNKEKQKLIEKKQKESAAFVNFFVPKKVDDKLTTVSASSKFMPFEIKSDMRLAPLLRRQAMTDDEKNQLTNYLQNIPNDNNSNYLKELINGKFIIGKSFRTWPFEEEVNDDDDDDDVVIVEDNVDKFGESICEDVEKSKKMRVKFLKFHENRRPPYYGTWRKKSNLIKPKKPLIEDKIFFDYDIDSDDDWEEEEQGESLNGSDDDDDNEQSENNDDYEVDNEFFVPHGHLSDDEIDDELTKKLSPELLKEKLRLLKDEFDHDHQLKTQKIKPRSIGCIWYNKNDNDVDEAIDKHLQSYAMITNGQIIIKKIHHNSDSENNDKKNLYKSKELPPDLIPVFLKSIHGKNNKKRFIVGKFVNYLNENGYEIDISQANLLKLLKQYAEYEKCTETGPLLNKRCWIVHKYLREQYNIDF